MKEDAAALFCEGPHPATSGVDEKKSAAVAGTAGTAASSHFGGTAENNEPVPEPSKFSEKGMRCNEIKGAQRRPLPSAKLLEGNFKDIVGALKELGRQGKRVKLFADFDMVIGTYGTNREPHLSEAYFKELGTLTWKWDKLKDVDNERYYKLFSIFQNRGWLDPGGVLASPPFNITRDMDGLNSNLKYFGYIVMRGHRLNFNLAYDGLANDIKELRSLGIEVAAITSRVRRLEENLTQRVLEQCKLDDIFKFDETFFFGGEKALVAAQNMNKHKTIYFIDDREKYVSQFVGTEMPALASRQKLGDSGCQHVVAYLDKNSLKCFPQFPKDIDTDEAKEKLLLEIFEKHMPSQLEMAQRLKA
mmetsp:Transcript_8405/g.20668  ORF Transcript_8405/g.20668 Transcript_8405/m.20668 type:complete len:360 (+) Transcript_8405:1-1080(+)